MKKTSAMVLILLSFSLLSGCGTVKESNNSQSSNEASQNQNIDEEQDTGEEVSLTSEDKIYNYLQAESEETLSQYYELLGFKISNYEETVVNNLPEAVFNYTITYKNFDKDPDTVEYIKQAKENNDSNYQTYYDEYLQPKELNMELKAIINNDDKISLYTDVNPHSEREWVECKISDILISDN